MKKTPNLLFVGGRNQRNSQAAVDVLKHDQRCFLRWVELDPQSERFIRAEDVEWADLMFVMSDIPRDQIRSAFLYLDFPDPEVLSIEKPEQYSDAELRDLLKKQINFILEIGYDL